MSSMISSSCWYLYRCYANCSSLWSKRLPWRGFSLQVHCESLLPRLQCDNVSGSAHLENQRVYRHHHPLYPLYRLSQKHRSIMGRNGQLHLVVSPQKLPPQFLPTNRPAKTPSLHKFHSANLPQHRRSKRRHNLRVHGDPAPPCPRNRTQTTLRQHRRRQQRAQSLPACGIKRWRQPSSRSSLVEQR